jgi:hypothetical protein
MAISVRWSIIAEQLACKDRLPLTAIRRLKATKRVFGWALLTGRGPGETGHRSRRTIG